MAFGSVTSMQMVACSGGFVRPRKKNIVPSTAPRMTTAARSGTHGRRGPDGAGAGSGTADATGTGTGAGMVGRVGLAVGAL